MNIKIKAVCGVLILVMITTQSYAMAETTNHSLMAVGVSLAMPQFDLDPNEVSARMQELDADLDSSESNLSRRQQRRQARIMNRFTRELPGIKKHVRAKVTNASSDGLDSIILQAQSEATYFGDAQMLHRLSQLVSLPDALKREELISIVDQQLEAAIPLIAHHFVLSKKWHINGSEVAEWFHPAPKGVWFPDLKLGHVGGNKAGKIYAIIVGVILLFSIFGIPIKIAFLLVASLLLFAIWSAVMDMKLMRPRRTG